MAKQRPEPQNRRPVRYEYRVWGEHASARKWLKRNADEQTTELVKDCYLLVDDSTWNAKVRDNTLKIKQLVDEHKGFEQWTSNRHRSAASAPTPFDEIFEELKLDRPQRGKRYHIREAVDGLDPGTDVRAVFVTKTRQRFRIGELRAEVTDIEILDSGQMLHTLSIDGFDLARLRSLRKELGLRASDNVAVHRVLDEATS